MERLALLIAAAVPLFAHVGSPDVFYEGSAGPYRLLVTIRPPEVIPGVAEIEVRSTEGDSALDGLTLVPIPLTGLGADLAPAPDQAERVPGETGAFRGRLWLMKSGAW